jgi:hypothetical protein
MRNRPSWVSDTAPGFEQFDKARHVRALDVGGKPTLIASVATVDSPFRHRRLQLHRVAQALDADIVDRQTGG